MIKLLNVAVAVGTESGDWSVHLLSYAEGYPETIAQSLSLMHDEEFPYITQVLVDVQDDYADLNSLGRKSNRLKEEVLKAIKNERKTLGIE